MGRTTAALLAAAMLAAGCGGEDEPAAEPTGTTTTEAQETPTEESAFDPDSVQAVIVSKEDKGGQAEVHFVAGEDADFAAAADDCVEHYLDEEGYASAYCFAFATVEDFEYANVNMESGGMKATCWRARAGQALSGDRTSEDENVTYEMLGCPSSEQAASLATETPVADEPASGDEAAARDAVVEFTEAYNAQDYQVAATYFSDALVAQCGSAEAVADMLATYDEENYLTFELVGFDWQDGSATVRLQYESRVASDPLSGIDENEIDFVGSLDDWRMDDWPLSGAGC